MIQTKHFPFKLPAIGKFETDVLWNIASFGFQGVMGIALNAIIGRVYGPTTLGIFNQVLALLILYSQFGVFGIQYSVLKHVAQYSSDRELCDRIISSALAVTLATSTAVTIAAYLTLGWVARFFESPSVADGWFYALPGLWCFSLNKVLFAILNGFSRMKAYAFAGAVRFALWAASLAGCALMGVPGEHIGVIFSIGEGALFLLLLTQVRSSFELRRVPFRTSWYPTHLRFGLNGFLGGTLTELNTRVDVLILGHFVANDRVGIYSMAALLVEGLLQLTVAIRNNYNPIMTTYLAEGEGTRLEAALRRGRRATYLLMGALGAVSLAAYPLFTQLAIGRPEFNEAWLPFAVMLALLVSCAGYLPFNMIFIQAGMPGVQTLYQALVLVTTVALNAVLIPRYEVLGAAYGMGLSLVLSAVYLKLMTRRILKLSL